MSLVLNFLRDIPVLVMIIPLLFCSVMIFAVFIERIIAFKILDKNYSLYLDNIDLLRESSSKFNPLMEFLKIAYVQNKKFTSIEIEKHSHEAIRYIERFTGIVSTIATISPMIGLLGTVTGMMKSFSALSSGATASQRLAGGITEALLTTALGLLVAIPSIILYNYMVNKSAYLIKETELIANRIANEKV